MREAGPGNRPRGSKAGAGVGGGGRWGGTEGTQKGILLAKEEVRG